MNDDVHVIPNFGAEHECSPKCWCEPTLKYTDKDTGRSVWVHKEPQ